MMALLDHPVPKRESKPKTRHAWATAVVLLGLLVNAVWLVLLFLGMIKGIGWVTGLL